MPYTAQHILQGVSALPEDRFVNVFRFTDPDPGTWGDEDVADSIAKGVSEFFTGLNSTATVASYLSTALLADAEIRIYNDAHPEPREPMIRTYNMGTRVGPTNLPHEVALCLSFYGNRNIPRQRGRLFIGPLNDTAMGAGAGEVPRPTLQVMDDLADSATRLAVRVDGTGPSGLRWAVRSAGPYSDGSGVGVVTYTAVTDGWIDNGWDTQRRRGIAPTTRQTWTRGG